MQPALGSGPEGSLYDRFGVHGPLGSGQHGSVFAAWDNQRRCMVALKLLNEEHSESISRLKYEFRSLADVSHPNLVQLYDLLSDGEIWLMTMELIEGMDLTDFVSVCTRQQFEQAFAGVARGIHALHGTGHVHGDIKPTNIRVGQDDRAVLLDFGLIARVRHQTAQARGYPSVLGSPLYTAPEIIRGEEATTKSDWYSFGAVLFEMLTGQPPIQAPNINQLMMRKAGHKRLTRKCFPGFLDEELIALLTDLLDPDPNVRPGVRRVLATLGQTPGAFLSQPTEPIFVGRRRELEMLRDALDETMERNRPVLRTLLGPSSIGKTRLAQEFLEECEQVTQFVFRGRCHENELLPFRAFDAAIEEMAAILMKLEAKGTVLTVGELGALQKVFPAMNRVPSVRQATLNYREQLDQKQLRTEAFAAISDTLRAMSRLFPVVFLIDDVQWGDRDSAMLIRDLLYNSPEASQLLFVLTCRSEEHDRYEFVEAVNLPAEAQAAHDPSPCELVEIYPLTELESFKLARALNADEDITHILVEEAQGNPLYLTELARMPPLRSGEPVSLNALFEQRIDALAAHERDTLATLALLGRPCRVSELPYLSAEPARIRTAIARLKNDRLVRFITNRLDVRIEVVHDRVRQLARRAIPPQRAIELHLNIARGLTSRGTEDAQALFRHYYSAGAQTKAARYAFQAAEQAINVLAFDHAADLLKAGLRLGNLKQDRRAHRLVQLARCQSKSGQILQAARTYQQASDLARPGPLKVRSTLKSAEYFIRDGQLAKGQDLLKEATRAVDVDVPDGNSALFAAYVGQRKASANLPEESDQRSPDQTPDASCALRIDVTWTAARLMSDLKVEKALYLQALNLNEALKTDDPAAQFRALTMQAVHDSIDPDVTDRSHRLLERAYSLLDRVEDPTFARAWFSYGSGLVDYHRGSFEDSVRKIGEAISILSTQRSGERWEIGCMQLQLLHPLFVLGRFKELRRRGPELMRLSELEHDRTQQVDVALRSYMFELAADRPYLARRNADRAIAKWDHGDHYLQHFNHVLATLSVLLYQGEADAAIDLADSHVTAFKQNFLWRHRMNRVEFYWRLASALLAGSRMPRRLGDRMLYMHRAHMVVAQMRGEQMPWSNGIADLLQGQHCLLSRDDASAERFLRRALETFSSLRANHFKWAVQRRLARMLGGRSGHEVVSRVDALMQKQGVEDPEKFCRIIMPI